MSVDWKEVWERKGRAESSDQYEVSGFGDFRHFDTESAAKRLCDMLGIEASDKVLEIGCSGALLGRHLKEMCEYVGSDYSRSVVEKTIELNRISAVCCEANDLIFKNKTFDHVFAFSVLQYFPNLDYARKALDEMTRVARKTICVLDVPTESHEAAHLLYTEDFFAGWQITDSLYSREHRRFSATLRL